VRAHPAASRLAHRKAPALRLTARPTAERRRPTAERRRPTAERRRPMAERSAPNMVRCAHRAATAARASPVPPAGARSSSTKPRWTSFAAGFIRTERSIPSSDLVVAVIELTSDDASASREIAHAVRRSPHRFREPFSRSAVTMKVGMPCR
jgi:hypothetical protein